MSNNYNITGFHIKIKNKQFIRDLFRIIYAYDKVITFVSEWFQDIFHQENFPEPEHLEIDYLITEDDETLCIGSK